MSKLTDKLMQVKREVEACLRAHLPPVDPLAPANLVVAMHYSLFSGGKRLRPLLLYLWDEMFGVPNDISTHLATAVECFHTYTLIHDDLPAMDNDGYRRQQPSCHKQFDEATAILAGTALLSLSIELMLTLPGVTPKTRVILTSYFCHIMGAQGIMWGQAMDLAREKRHKPYDMAEELQIDYDKTGRLLEFCCTVGALLTYVEKGAMPMEVSSPVKKMEDEGAACLVSGESEEENSFNKREGINGSSSFTEGVEDDFPPFTESVKNIEKITLMNDVPLDGGIRTTLQRLSAFGRHFGIAYQLVDDLKDGEYRFGKRMMLQKLKQSYGVVKEILREFGEEGEKREKEEKKGEETEVREKEVGEKEEVGEREGKKRMKGERKEKEEREETKEKKREMGERLEMLREVVERVKKVGERGETEK